MNRRPNSVSLPDTLQKLKREMLESRWLSAPEIDARLRPFWRKIERALEYRLEVQLTDALSEVLWNEWRILINLATFDGEKAGRKQPREVLALQAALKRFDNALRKIPRGSPFAIPSVSFGELIEAKVRVQRELAEQIAGRPANRHRPRLRSIEYFATEVARHLRVHGVKVAISRTGNFAGALAILLKSAGLQPPADIHRLVKAAVDNARAGHTVEIWP